MKNVEILVGEETIIKTIVKIRRKRFLIGSPSVYFVNKGKGIEFYYNVNNIHPVFETELKKFAESINAKYEISSNDVYTTINKDTFKIEIPKGYKFKIENK